MFVRMNSPGPSIERSTCDSAARWKMSSGRNSANAFSIAAWSQMSALRNLRRGFDDRSVAGSSPTSFRDSGTPA